MTKLWMPHHRVMVLRSQKRGEMDSVFIIWILADSSEIQTNLFSSSIRLKEFKSSLFGVFHSAHTQSVKMKALMDDINKGREKHFTEAEVRNALARMQDDNQIMVSDDIIFLI